MIYIILISLAGNKEKKNKEQDWLAHTGSLEP